MDLDLDFRAWVKTEACKIRRTEGCGAIQQCIPMSPNLTLGQEQAKNRTIRMRRRHASDPTRRTLSLLQTNRHTLPPPAPGRLDAEVPLVHAHAAVSRREMGAGGRCLTPPFPVRWPHGRHSSLSGTSRGRRLA